MIVFVLTILVALKQGPVIETHIFTDAFSCQVAQGAAANQLNSDPTVLGWSFPAECEAAAVPTKA